MLFFGEFLTLSLPLSSKDKINKNEANYPQSITKAVLVLKYKSYGLLHILIYNMYKITVLKTNCINR